MPAWYIKTVMGDLGSYFDGLPPCAIQVCMYSRGAQQWTNAYLYDTALIGCSQR